MLSQDVKMLNYTRAIPGRYDAPYEAETPAAERSAVSAVHLEVYIIAAAVALMMGVFYFVSGYAAQKSYDMQELRTEIIALEKQNAVARLEVARLESPARIQRIAETELGMLVPQRAIYGSSDTYVNPMDIHE